MAKAFPFNLNVTPVPCKSLRHLYFPCLIQILYFRTLLMNVREASFLNFPKISRLRHAYNRDKSSGISYDEISSVVQTMYATLNCRFCLCVTRALGMATSFNFSAYILLQGKSFPSLSPIIKF